VLVRAARGAAPEPLEVFLIRRQRSMRFLGGYYAFPGGKVDRADATPAAFARCHGLDPIAAAQIFPDTGGRPALAVWITAVREVLEETGVILACDGHGTEVDPSVHGFAADVESMRSALVGKRGTLPELLAARGWYADVRGLRYVAHYITPPASAIRFTARFFLCPVPHGQSPRLIAEEVSEARWIGPSEAHGRFCDGAMAMAEPAEYTLAYLAQFGSLDELWAAHADRQLKLHGLVDRIDFPRAFDWTRRR
jgi:8-oxo-dGTP pyrophosphatase MutT (NUDIX family)